MIGKKAKISQSGGHGYHAVLADVVQLIETARSAAARSVNAIMTATYWRSAEASWRRSNRLGAGWLR